MKALDSLLILCQLSAQLHVLGGVKVLIANCIFALTLYWPSAVRLSSSTEGTVATRYESDRPVYKFCIAFVGQATSWMVIMFVCYEILFSIWFMRLIRWRVDKETT